MRARFDAGHRGSGSCRHFPDAVPVPGRQWLRYPHDSRPCCGSTVACLLLAVVDRVRRTREAVVLVELGLVEQRYKAVLEVLDGRIVTDVARRYGVARQTVHTGCGGTRRGWVAAWLIGARGGGRVRTRCPRRSRRGSSRCGGSIPVGGRGRSCITGPRRGDAAAGPRSVHRRPGAPWSDRARRRGGGRSDYAAGSGPGRWSCGRWTSWAVHLADGTELRRSTGVDDHSRYCVWLGWSPGRPPGRCATRWPWRCGVTGSRTRS